MDDFAPVELLVCTTCRRGLEPGDAGERPGALLHRALAAGVRSEGVSLLGVECLSNCDRGCSVALRGGPRRWTYVYGNLDPSGADMILEGVARYRATPDGLVPWRERSGHFRRNCVARIPPTAPVEPDG